MCVCMYVYVCMCVCMFSFVVGFYSSRATSGSRSQVPAARVLPSQVPGSNRSCWGQISWQGAVHWGGAPAQQMCGRWDRGILDEIENTRHTFCQALPGMDWMPLGVKGEGGGREVNFSNWLLNNIVYISWLTTPTHSLKFKYQMSFRKIYF